MKILFLGMHIYGTVLDSALSPLLSYLTPDSAGSRFVEYRYVLLIFNCNYLSFIILVHSLVLHFARSYYIHRGEYSELNHYKLLMG